MIDKESQLKFLLILLVGAIFLAFLIFSPFLAPVSLAAIFAVTLHPLYKNLLRKFRDYETPAAIVTVIIAAICILVPLSLIGAQILNEAGSLYGSLIGSGGSQGFAAEAIRDFGEKFTIAKPGVQTFLNDFSADLDIYIKKALEWLLVHFGSALSSVTTLILDLFIFFIGLYYFLRDGKKLVNKLIILSPLEDADDKIIFENLESAVNSVVKGSLTIAFIQGILTAIGFWIFGVPSAILWGTVAAVAALIPAIGTSIVILPGIIYLFVTGNIGQAIGLLIWGSLAVGLIDNFLGPKLMSKGMELHPLLVLLSVLGGISFFGAIGVFLGPLTISMLFAFIKIYSYLAEPAKR